MEYKDYYKIMGVAEGATADEIRKAYRKLVRKYHPDVSQAAGAEEKFKDLREAYEVLKDPAKRAEYDQLKKLGAYQQNGSFRPPPHWQSAAPFDVGGFSEAEEQPFSDFFASLFGRGGTPRRAYGGGEPRTFRTRGEDVQARLALSLEEAVRGGEKQVQFTVAELDESGFVTHRQKVLNIKIPPAMEKGQFMRLRGQGAPGVNGGENGDLFVEIDLEPHPFFTVEGQDLYLTLPITPWEAALGATITVPGLASRLNVKIPKGATSGQKLRLTGKGLPGKSGSGDQIIVLQVALPRSHSAEAETLYKKLADLEKGFNPRTRLEK